MFDADCLAILLTALELQMFEERRLEAGQLMQSRVYDAVFWEKRRSVFDHVPDPGAKL